MNSVSVIIPALNEEDSIADAIRSARAARAHEVIVVDGGSNDGTAEIARSLCRLEISPEPGRARQQNLGAAAANGDVLLFLHADCRLNRDSLTEMRQRLAAANVVGGCFQQQIDKPGLRYRVMEAANAWRVRLLKWAYGDQGIFVRRDVFERLGGFPDLRFMEDLFFMKQLKGVGKVVLLDSTLQVSARRWQRRGMAMQTLRNWILIAAAHLGVSPNRLAQFYPNVR